jgi:aspartate aminotransferase
MSFVRPEIAALRNNGITSTALPRINDPKVIPLWFGEGDIPTPDFIREATKKALDEGKTFYNHTRGRIHLREAVKDYLDRTYDFDIDLERITVPGSTMLGLNIACQMALTQGDHGLIVSPAWPNIETCFAITGAEVEHVRQRQVDGQWALVLDDLFERVRPNTRAIFVNSPCNPTGWVMREPEQRRLLEFCRERQILLIADEVYHRTVFDETVAPSFLQIAEPEDPLIVVSGFSKAWAMTGWRVGWVVAPASLGEQWAALSECFNTGATSFVQFGAAVALEKGDDFVKQLVAQYAGGRDLVLEMLGDHPRIEMLRPEGAFYAFPRVRGIKSSLDFVQGVLDEEDVGLAPGSTFGPGNEQHFRLCYALTHDRLKEALKRIVNYIDRLPPTNE